MQKHKQNMIKQIIIDMTEIVPSTIPMMAPTVRVLAVNIVQDNMHNYVLI